MAESHLSGKTCLGFYLTRDDDTVLCSCVDLDNHNGENPNVATDTRKVTEKLDELGFDDAYLVERSQSGVGFHVWVFFSEPLSAALVRRFWKQVLQDSGVRAEIYPKQDSIKSTEKGLGNLVRYPLWNQSEVVSWAEDDRLGWGWYRVVSGEGTDQWLTQMISDVSVVSEREIENSVTWYDSEMPESIITENGLPAVVENLIRKTPDGLLARRWAGDKAGLNDKSLSAVAQSLAFELVRNYVAPEDIDLCLEHWGKVNEYHKALRPEWRRVTIRRAYDIVAGRSGKKLENRQGGTLHSLTKGYVDAVIRGEDPVMSTGILALDDSIGGFAKGELVIISARPSHGKSALAIEFLDHLSGMGHAGLFVSLEMTPHMTSNRLIARIAADIPKSEWDNEDVQVVLHERIAKHFENRAPIFFEADCSRIDKMEEVIKTYVAEKNVSVVCVDYQGLASGSHNNEYADQSQIVSTLKRLAKEHDLIMLDLVQMNRAIEKEKGREPTMSDLRASGQIEADADVILIPRYSCMDDATQSPNKYEIHVLKNRNRGIKCRRVDITFDPDRQTFK